MGSKISIRWYVYIGVSAILIIFGVVAYLFLHRHSLSIKVQRTFEEQSTVARKHQFQDLNETHLAAAKKHGIKPLQNRKEVEGGKINRIGNCDLYMVDGLTYSVPYLTTGAYNLLTEIGTRFQAELRQKGCRPHRIIVTSVLRTKEDVSALKKVNGNATANSAHMYGTTSDITYQRYNRLSLEGKPVSNQQMTNILGEVLRKQKMVERKVGTAKL